MPIRISEAAETSVLLFKIIEDLGVRCGYERSFKMREGKLLANRFLIAINTEDIKPTSLLDICRQLNMPHKFSDAFKAHLADANTVALGFEDNEPGCVYKVYLEFWEKLIKDYSQSYKTPALLHHGFKWKTDDSTQAAESRYWCYPELSAEEILKRVHHIYQGHEDRTSAEVAVDIIKFATRKSREAPIIYLEVGEENGPRKSFDINLYRANFRVGEIEPLLSKAAEHYLVPAEKLARLYQLVRNKLFGHLSGGVNNEGKDFLTIYYEV